MNYHNIFWIFKWIRILLCIELLLVPSWAKVTRGKTTYLTNDEVKFPIFDNKVREFESQLIKSLETQKNFFASQEFTNAVLFGLLASSFYAPLGPVAGAIFVLRSFLAEESDWREKFTRTIKHEIRRGIALDNVQKIQAILRMIGNKFKLMSENNNDTESRKRIASIIHTNLDIMLSYFDGSESIFKKYPLIGAPPLIELAQIIAYFSPIAKVLIPLEANSPELTCKMRNILLDYRPRTVNARLETLHIDSSMLVKSEAFSESTFLAMQLFNVTLIKYNQYGYNNTIPGLVDCQERCVTVTKNDFKTCLKDDFRADANYVAHVDCIADYASLIRHRVEDIFPVELLNRLCGKPPQTTGFGWLTIKLKAVRAHRRWDDEACDLAAKNPCDPYVELFIDDELQLQTPFREDTCCFDDLDVTHTSKKISKNTRIKIEVWDKDDFGFLGFLYQTDDLVIRTKGNVDSFLRNGHRGVTVSRDKENSIETISFWQDEYIYE